MYSKSPQNSWKKCECDNNNFSSAEAMKKFFNGTNKTKTRKDNNYNNTAVGVKTFKNFEIRREEVLAIRNRFPTKIPVIVQRFYKETHLPQLDKSKFLVPQEITMSQFHTIIRNRIQLKSNQALYLLVNNRSMMSLSLTLAKCIRSMQKVMVFYM